MTTRMNRILAPDPVAVITSSDKGIAPPSRRNWRSAA